MKQVLSHLTRDPFYICSSALFHVRRLAQTPTMYMLCFPLECRLAFHCFCTHNYMVHLVLFALFPGTDARIHDVFVCVSFIFESVC